MFAGLIKNYAIFAQRFTIHYCHDPLPSPVGPGKTTALPEDRFGVHSLAPVQPNRLRYRPFDSEPGPAIPTGRHLTLV